MSETERPQQGKVGWLPIVLGSLVFTGLIELVWQLVEGRHWWGLAAVVAVVGACVAGLETVARWQRRQRERPSDV